MAKIIYCTEAVAAQLRAQTQNISNMFGGIPVYTKPDKWFEGIKTKDGKQANWIEVDESAFKMQIPPFNFDAIGKQYELTVWATPEANDLIKDGKYKFKRMPDHWFPESYTEDGKKANVFIFCEGKANNYYAIKCVESEISIDELMVDIEKLMKGDDNGRKDTTT